MLIKFGFTARLSFHLVCYSQFIISVTYIKKTYLITEDDAVSVSMHIENAKGFD